MKAREPRRNVALPARMRGDHGWMDVTIRNISSRGMGMQSLTPPPRGAYVEIFRLRHRIVGRVAWSEGKRFGIHTRERLDVSAVVSDQAKPRTLPGEPLVERRARPRPASDAASLAADIHARLERSRRTAAAINFGAITCGGAAAALLLAGTTADMLSVPMRQVAAHLQRPAHAATVVVPAH